ncbi:MAG: sugar kinase [Desulforhabdus sp.]|jgi:2-dehydro-3-deoxygluconokinase|nr:sugar kinase [Desulforhabdus sp.]
MLSLRDPNKCKYQMAALGSINERAIPEGREPSEWTNRFVFEATGAEYNVLCGPANWGMSTAMFTALVPNTPPGMRILRDIRSRGVTPIYKEFTHNGITGPRHAIMWSDLGAGIRGPKVYYDRAEEAGAMLKPGDFDWKRYFEVEGVRWVHVTGLFMSLSRYTGQLVLEMAKAARAAGTVVSVDLNYRDAMWKANGITQELFRSIVAESTVVVGNEEDFQLALGITGPDAGGSNLEEKRAGFTAMLTKAVEQFPNIKLFATTLREVHSAQEHTWSALMWYEGKIYDAPTKDIEVYCRIAGGDAFAGGLFYGMLTGMEPQEALNYGWAHGALMVTYSGDTSKASSPQDVVRAMKGQARVAR